METLTLPEMSNWPYFRGFPSVNFGQNRPPAQPRSLQKGVKLETNLASVFQYQIYPLGLDLNPMASEGGHQGAIDASGFLGSCKTHIFVVEGF